jgi:hypothetical protein
MATTRRGEASHNDDPSVRAVAMHRAWSSVSSDAVALRTAGRGVPHYRQGDILLLKVDALPELAIRAEPIRRVGREIYVVSEGRSDGHTHLVPAGGGIEMFRDGATIGDAGLYLVVKEAGVVLWHEEHAALDVPPGIYRVVKQREFSAAAASLRGKRWVWHVD